MHVQQNTEEPSEAQPLTGHLGELRRRVLLCAAVFAVAVAASMTQVDAVLEFLRRPLAGRVEQFAFFAPTEAFVAYLKLACLAGLALAMPFILGQVWGFVRSGLTAKERRFGILFILWGSLQFVLGLAFAYYVLLPVSLRFLLGIGTGFLEPVLSIDRYLSFVVMLSFWSGMIFQLPVILFLLTRMGVVTPTWLAQQRPYAMLTMVVFAALVTPTTDIVNLSVMTLPMVLLYEFSIWITRFAEKK